MALPAVEEKEVFTNVGIPLIPADREELAIILRAFMIPNAVRELGYDLNNRSGLVYLSLWGIEMLLKKCLLMIGNPQASSAEEVKCWPGPCRC